MKRNALVVVMAIGVIALLSMAFQSAWIVPDKYKTMNNSFSGTEDEDEIGVDLFETHCASCHGDEGLGDGSKANTLDTPLRDWTEDAVQSQTDGELYYKSFVGRDEMPNFEKKIKDEEERWLIVNYIRMLAN